MQAHECPIMAFNSLGGSFFTYCIAKWLTYVHHKNTSSQWFEALRSAAYVPICSIMWMTRGADTHTHKWWGLWKESMPPKQKPWSSWAYGWNSSRGACASGAYNLVYVRMYTVQGNLINLAVQAEASLLSILIAHDCGTTLVFCVVNIVAFRVMFGCSPSRSYLVLGGCLSFRIFETGGGGRGLGKTRFSYTIYSPYVFPH